MVSYNSNTIFEKRDLHVAGKTGKIPAYKAIAYTLDISARFMCSTLLGRQSVEQCDRLMKDWSRRIFRAGDATLRVAGLENIQPNEAYVYMSNHKSLLDIPAVFGAIPGSLRMVFKDELRKLPIWGNALVASGFIPVDRKNTKRAIEQMEMAKEQINKGISVWIAPEGTRSRDGQLQDFKKGGFHLAKQLGVRIIPCWIDGTNTIIPPDDFRAHYGGDATVHFGVPLDTSPDDTIESLMGRVRNAMLELSKNYSDDQDLPSDAAAS